MGGGSIRDGISTPASEVNARLVVAGLAAGIGWGALGWLLGHRALGPMSVGGALASPLVGVAVTWLTHDRFAAGGGRARLGWSLLSVYLGSMGFALGCGAARMIDRPEGRPLDLLLEPFVSTLWGVTMTGFLLFLWPMAYATHWLLAERLEH